MSNENEILLNIYEMTNLFLIQVYRTRLNIAKIKYDICNLNNNYFDKNPCSSELLDIDEIYLTRLTERLSNYKNNIEDTFKKLCVHEWVHDYIDISPDVSQIICYCVKCEVTKG